MLVFPAANSLESKASGKIMPFKTVEQPPFYEGCEKEGRDCTLQKITNFFVDEFNPKVLPDDLEETDLAIKMILDETGALAWQRIITDFPEVETEAIRSLKELPTLTPAIHKGTEVSVIIDFVVKLSLGNHANPQVDTPPFPNECKDSEVKKECLSKSIQSFINKNVQVPNLKKGGHFAELSFVIDAEGKVAEIKVTGENEKLNRA